MQETNFVISDYFVINEEYQDNRLYFRSDIDYSKIDISELEKITKYFLNQRKIVNGDMFSFRLASFLHNWNINPFIYVLIEYNKDKGKLKAFQIKRDYNNNKNDIKCINDLLSIDNNKLNKDNWITFQYEEYIVSEFSQFLFSNRCDIKRLSL